MARRLRANASRVELVLGRAKLKKVLGDANSLGVRRVWLLGPDEVGRGVVKLRDLSTGEEREEPID